MDFKEEEIKNFVYNTANDKDGFKFICCLIEHTQPYSKGMATTERQDCYNRGKKDAGVFISELLQKYHFEKYTELQRIRSKEL